MVFIDSKSKIQINSNALNAFAYPTLLEIHGTRKDKGSEFAHAEPSSCYAVLNGLKADTAGVTHVFPGKHLRNTGYWTNHFVDVIKGDCWVAEMVCIT